MTAPVPDTRGAPYAGVLRRVAAYALDSLLLFVSLALVHGIVFVAGLNPLVNGPLTPTGPLLHLWVFATATLPVLLYFTLGFRSRRGATLGMRAFQLRIVSDGPSPLGSWRALARATVLLIPFEVNHVLLFSSQLYDPQQFQWEMMTPWILVGVYLALPLLNARRQSVHDLVAGSVVVRTP